MRSTRRAANCQQCQQQSATTGTVLHTWAMASTHTSEVREEIPSGMVPLRELMDRSRYPHPGGHTHSVVAHTRVQRCDDHNWM